MGEETSASQRNADFTRRYSSGVRMYRERLDRQQNNMQLHMSGFSKYMFFYFLL